jgi:hypothetical protein
MSAVVVAVYLLRCNSVAGLIADDAWYMLLAQAIARGQGYNLVNAPLPGGFPSYPPGFALLLSPLFLVAPFPATVWLIKIVSVVAALGTGLLSARYFESRGLPGSIARGMAMAVALTPAIVWLSTSTAMSEPVYMFALLGTVVLSGRRPVAAAVTCGAAVLIRSAGLPILGAVTAWLAVQRRWRALTLFAGTVVVCLLPWFVYSRVHAPGPEERAAHGGIHGSSYAQQFWMRWAGDSRSGSITAAELPERVLERAIDVFGRDVLGIVLPELLRGPSESGEETIALGGARSQTSSGSMGSAPGTMAISAVLSVILLIGFAATARREATAAEFVVPASLGLTLLWPHWSYRFVLPLTPFLYLYLVSGVQALSKDWRRVTRIALLCIIGLHLYDHAMYLARPRQAVWLGDAAEVDEVIGWLKRNTEPGHVATTNPALVYLHTGRKTLALDDYRDRWGEWRALGVRYLAALRPIELPDPSLPYTVRHKTARRGLWVVEMHDPTPRR